MAAPSAALAGKVDQLLRTQIKDLQCPSPEEVHRLVYEIELRQNELEEQNEELRKTQQRLEAYRDRYVDLYDFAPLGYATLDEDGYVQEINLAGAGLLGVQREALIGYAFGDYVAKEDQAAFLEHVRQCVRERRDVTSELRLIAKDGRTIAAQVHSVPIVGSKDDTLCKTAITDITQRRTMEVAIRQSQAFLQTVIDAIPDTMLVIGRDYHILLANRAARDVWVNIDLGSCLTCHKVSHHRDAPCEGGSESCPLRDVVATKSPLTVVHTHYDAQGDEIFVEVNAAPVFDDTGEVTSIIEVCRDITEQKRAQDALEQERNLLRTLIDNLPDYIYVKDARGRFMAANLATAQIMGAAAPNDLFGKTDADFYPPGLAAEYRADEERVLRSGQPVLNKDEPHLDPGGNLRVILTTKVPLKSSQGTIVGLVGISRDITDRKRAEDSLRLAQAQVAEQQRHQRERVEAELAKVQDQLVRQTRLAAIGQVAASIVHDLRNPLGVVQNTTYLLRNCLGDTQSEGKEYLGLIDRELDTINRIISNLTEMAQAKPPKKELVDLDRAVQEVFVRLKQNASTNCSVECDPRPFAVAADPVQLRQVLGNVMANAIQAMPEGGQIRVRARREGRMDVLVFEDDGSGVGEEVRDRIFEPLFTTKCQGTGLGLPICRQIIERHGGTIDLLEKEGPGTAFQIRLPSAVSQGLCPAGGAG